MFVPAPIDMKLLDNLVKQYKLMPQALELFKALNPGDEWDSDLLAPIEDLPDWFKEQFKFLNNAILDILKNRNGEQPLVLSRGKPYPNGPLPEKHFEHIDYVSEISWFVIMERTLKLAHMALQILHPYHYERFVTAAWTGADTWLDEIEEVDPRTVEPALDKNVLEVVIAAINSGEAKMWRSFRASSDKYVQYLYVDREYPTPINVKDLAYNSTIGLHSTAPKKPIENQDEWDDDLS